MWPFDKIGKRAGQSAAGYSLNGQIASFGNLEETLDTAMAGYRGTLDSVVNHTPRILKEQSGDLKKNLRQIRVRLEGQPSTALLKETVKDVDRELSHWGKTTEAGFEAQERETKDAMAAVAVLAEALGGHEKTYGVRFRGISKKLRLLTTSNDISEIRKKLQGEIELLEQYCEEMTKETEAALGRMRELDKAKRERSLTVAALETGDARMRLTDVIRQQVKTDDRVAVVRLTTTATVAAKGSALVVARLQDVFDSPGMSGQWGSETFVSITRLSLPEAAARLEIVERDLSTKLGGKLEGMVFEKTPGTTVAEFLGRFELKSEVAA